MIGYIFAIRNILDDNFIYIGSTFQPLKNKMNRLRYDFKHNKLKKTHILYNEFEKYGTDFFVMYQLYKYDLENDEKNLLKQFEIEIKKEYPKCVNFNDVYLLKEKPNRSLYDRNYRIKNIERINKRYKIKGLCPNCKKILNKYGIPRHLKNSCMGIPIVEANQE